MGNRLSRKKPQPDTLQATTERILMAEHPELADSPLLHTVRDGTIQDLHDLLQTGTHDVNERHPHDGVTPLLLAVQQRRVAHVDALLSAGADMEAVYESTGQTALLYSLDWSRMEIAHLLLARGAAVNVVDKLGMTFFTLCARAGGVSLLESLRELHSSEELQHLIEIEAEDASGHTALIYAAKQGQHAALRWLLRHAHADANHAHQGTQQTPLMYAVKSGDVESVKSLLEFGADVSVANAHGATALMFAARSGNAGVARVLLEAGADVRRGTSRGRTALWFAAGQLVDRDCCIMMQLLVEHGAEVDAACDMGRTPLMKLVLAETAHQFRLRPAQVLVALGASPWVRDKYGCSAIDHARANRHARMIREWLDAFAVKSALREMLIGTRVGGRDGADTSLTRLARHSIYDRNVMGIVWEFLLPEVHL